MWLMQGDCLEKMKYIESGSVDMVLADPPYGTTACKWDSVIDLERMWEQLIRISKPKAAIVMMAGQPFTTTLIASNMKMFKYDLVWDKQRSTGGAQASTRQMRSHETILVFSRGGNTYNPQFDQYSPQAWSKIRHEDAVCKAPEVGGGENISKGRKSLRNKNKHPGSVVRIKALPTLTDETVHGRHPTQKPVALMEYLLKTYTDAGETVLDFTMGSGTTGVACKNLGRDFIGIELDQDYFNVAKSRIGNCPDQLG